jgi:hypothetical protein
MMLAAGPAAAASTAEPPEPEPEPEPELDLDLEPKPGLGPEPEAGILQNGSGRGTDATVVAAPLPALAIDAVIPPTQHQRGLYVLYRIQARSGRREWYVMVVRTQAAPRPGMCMGQRQPVSYEML